MKLLTTFPIFSEFEKIKSGLDSMNIPYEVIDPSPGYYQVGCPAVVIDRDSRSALAASESGNFVSSGWIEYYPSKITVPSTPPPVFADDLFKKAS